MSRVDDSTADDDGSAVTATTKCTTERDDIDVVLADYEGTPSSAAQSNVAPSTSARDPNANARGLTATATGSGTDATALPVATAAEHGSLSQQLDDVQFGVNALAASVGTVSALVHDREKREAELDLPERLDALNDGLVGIHSAVATLPPDLTQRLSALGTDLRGIQMVLYESSAQIAALSAKQDADDGEEKAKDKELPPPPAEAAEPALPEINAKLDALAVLIQEVLARQDAAAAMAAKAAAAGAGAGAVAGSGAAKEGEADKATPAVSADKDAAKEAPKEAADAPAPAPAAAPADVATAAQLAEVQAMVTKLGEERALQTQQTADIAKCELLIRCVVVHY